MSAVADILHMSLTKDMSFTADIGYSVRYEGHIILQPRAARRGYPFEA
jgi:hypothetical protein